MLITLSNWYSFVVVSILSTTGWVHCDDNDCREQQILLLLIGTTYGSGDGSTTFNVPRLMMTVLFGVGEFWWS